MNGRADTQTQLAAAFVAGFNTHPQGALIKNAATKMTLYEWGDVQVPLTINDGEKNTTFVCCPRVGWTDFVREELTHFPNNWLVPPIKAVVSGIGVLARRVDLDRIVHVNNWMMSTNLPSGIEPALSTDQTAELAQQFPEHIIAMRSLTWRHSGALMVALRDAGWVFLPTRQVFIVDDVQRDSLSRRDARNDAKLWQKGRFAYEELTNVTLKDSKRIAELYDLLYLRKYSRLNPHYTSAFIQFAHQIGLLRFLVLRDDNGIIQGVGGMLRLGNHATMPLLGYDTGADRKDGLYRLTCHAGSLYAARHDLNLNMSSGATLFKQTRGATAEIEYAGFYVRHLPHRRQRPFALLQAIARHIGIPILQRYNL